VVVSKSPRPLLPPQHSAVPPDSRAQLYAAPAAIAVAPVTPYVKTGEYEAKFIALPSSPTSLAPQQTTVPPESSAHVWKAPAATATAPANLVPMRVVTATGVELGVVVPSPSWPSSLPPQHPTVPSESSAQACSRPAEIATAPVRVGTLTGVEENVIGPEPSWPASLLPQHSTAPPTTSAHAYSSPAEMAVTAVRLGMATGVVEVRLVVQEFRVPSRLSLQLPQHSTVPFERSAHV